MGSRPARESLPGISSAEDVQSGTHANAIISWACRGIWPWPRPDRISCTCPTAFLAHVFGIAQQVLVLFGLILLEALSDQGTQPFDRHHDRLPRTLGIALCHAAACGTLLFLYDATPGGFATTSAGARGGTDDSRARRRVQRRPPPRRTSPGLEPAHRVARPAGIDRPATAPRP